MSDTQAPTTDCLFARYQGQVREALRSVVADLPDEIAARVELTPARDAAHGDMATNAALLASKFARRRPVDIAADLVPLLSALPGVARQNLQGPVL